MSYQKENFGMMDEGYFVPRGQLIDWINQLLDLNITKIQQLGAGSIYCQIVDVIHPGKVTMNKVNWRAKNDYEFINNLKILQTAFEKVGVKRYVQVEKLAKAKYQDNLEFIQWLKRYYDLNCGDRGNDYNPRERRGNCPVDLGFADKSVVPKTYNSGGQMISKNDLPGKKVNPPVATKIQTKQQPPKIERHPETKPSIKTVKATSPSRNDKKREEPKQMGQSKSNDWENMYLSEAQKNKDLTIKIGMVEEVLRSDEHSELKVAMLEQILAIVRNQKMQAESHEMEVQDANQMTNEDDEII